MIRCESTFSAWRRNGAVVFTELDDLVVMLDTKTGMYYELNEVGSSIWHALEGESTVAGLQAALTAEFDMEAGACREDILGFLDELSRLDLTLPNRETLERKGNGHQNPQPNSTPPPPGKNRAQMHSTRRKRPGSKPSIRLLYGVSRTESSVTPDARDELTGTLNPTFYSPNS